MRVRRILTVAFLLLCGAGYVASQETIQGNQRKASVSAYNRRSGGVSIFSEFKSRLGKGSVTIRKSPFLYDEDLSGVDALFILSPTNEISVREASIIADYIDAGGTLVLGIHDLTGMVRSRNLLEVLKGGATIVEDPHFRNGQSVLLTPKQDLFVFKGGETYELYSSVLLDRTDCRGGGFECYAHEFTHGKGRVVMLAGLPFFGNVLVSRQANKQAALRLAERYGTVQIDEYHHFFTDRTFWSLLAKPSFSVPILGSILGALLLLAFGHSEFHERSSEGPRDEKPPRTLHGLGESIVFRVFEKPSAYPAILGRHREFLERLFPGRKKELEHARKRTLMRAIGQKEFLFEARRLLSLHRRWMRGE